MSKPFDFYQQVSGLIYDDSLGQPLTPFGLFYTDSQGISGIYYPLQVAQGNPFYLFNDGDIEPTVFNVRQFGNVNQELKDLPSYIFNISGDFYPASPDYTTFGSFYSGAISGSPLDIVKFNIVPSGNLLGNLIDISTISIVPSGNINACLVDVPKYVFTYSGNVQSGDAEVIPYRFSLYGDLKKKYNDSKSYTFQMYSIGFTPGIVDIIDNETDPEYSIFKLNTIIFSRAS